jgi:hypothetical protein
VIEMTEKHITQILDNASIVSLSENELNEIRAHARECGSCRGAYEAAQVSSVVLRSRAQSAVAPSPFFQTRVMAALRERQAVENVPAMLRLWGAAKALVSGMAVTTAALAFLSFALPSPATPAPDQAVSAYSAESVIMGTNDDQMTYDQVLSTIYADDDEAK